MEEVNETALTELVGETLQENDFDYGNMPQEEINMYEARIEEDHALVKVAGERIGETLTLMNESCQKYYGEKWNEKFLEWSTKRYGLKKTMIYTYMRAYKVRKNTGFVLTNSSDVNKISYLFSLPEEQQKQIIENVQLDELSRPQTKELVKRIKENGEYSDKLLEQIKQKDKELREKEEQSKQVTEQKDEEIKKLQEKVKELENVRPVAQTEPEVIEKIVEVEKVVEKEVIPEKIKQELETYKKLAKEQQNNIPDYILEEIDTLRQTVKEQDEQLKGAKRTVEAIATQQNSKFGTQNIDWGLLGNVINSFLSKASEYTYMKEAFKIENGKSKNFVKTQVDKIENWVIEMKRMMNTDLTIGDSIYVENNIEILEEEN